MFNKQTHPDNSYFTSTNNPPYRLYQNESYHIFPPTRFDYIAFTDIVLVPNAERMEKEESNNTPHRWKLK